MLKVFTFGGLFPKTAQTAFSELKLQKKSIQLDKNYGKDHWNQR
ncbi:hypothetical protein [Nostoc sp. CHAB 5836]|nr:hypothetical protein [Nostoc sp. CHAB 5836]